MKVVFTGGHPSPAFACIEYIRDKYPEWQLLLIGREVAQPGSGQQAWENQIALEYGVPFYGIDTGKSSAAGLAAVAHGAKIAKSVLKSLQILSKEKPDICLSFGSYVSVPIALACKLLGVPVIAHEQVRGAGRATRLVGRFAKRIALSHESSKKYFPAGKSVVTGLPLRPILFQNHPTPEWLSGAPTNKPIVVIMGGSTGSLWINELTGRVITQLTDTAIVIHQTGLPSSQTNWLEKAESLKNSLSAEKANAYYPRPTFTAQELSWLYHSAALVVSRAGANTVAELLAFAAPTLFIPLPTSAAGEQEENAQYAASKNGLMHVLDQSTLLDEEFIRLVRANLEHQRQPVDHHLSLAPQEKLVELILRVVQ